MASHRIVTKTAASTGLVFALLLGLASLALADEIVVVLKGGQRLTVTQLERRAGKVRGRTVKGEVFEIEADLIVSPPLDQIPEAGTAPAAPAAPDTLVLKSGQRYTVARLERRGERVRAQLADGRVFEVAADQVAAPPLDQIPAGRAAPAAGGTTLVLKSGQSFPVVKLEGRGERVRAFTADGKVYEFAAADVAAPPLDQIPGLQLPAPTPTPAPPTPVPAPLPVAPAPPAGPPVPDFVPIPDRWQIAYPDYPGRYTRGRLLDPYNQNVLKGDRPVAGQSVFMVLTGTLEAPTELRSLPIGSGVSTANPAELEFFGDGSQTFTTPRASLSLELFQGQTAFRPKTWALKATGVANLNYLRLRENNNVDVDVREGRSRERHDIALEEAFGEVKLLDLSHRFDTLSLRAGLQPFVSDFRGLVFADVNLGARLFGNLHANRWQYNAAFFDLLEKQTNSELNTFEKREQQVIVANVFRQDTFRPGYTTSFSFHHSKDDATRHFDANGFLVRPARVGAVRPHEVTSTYLGWAGDGHLGRLNLSHAAYYVFGTDEDNPLAREGNDISAGFGALELSLDRDWARFKVSGVFASGDDDAGDGQAHGFDSIYDRANFAGGDFSFWTRSGIPLTQTSVLLKTPGSLLPSLRSNKFEGQQSFVNPGLVLVGAGLDLDLTPKLRFAANLNYIRFHKTGALELLLFQPAIRKTVGLDYGAGFTWRPLLNENVVVTAGFTGLVSGAGFDDLYSSSCSVPGCGSGPKNLRNAFLNLKLTY